MSEGQLINISGSCCRLQNEMNMSHDFKNPGLQMNDYMFLAIFFSNETMINKLFYYLTFGQSINNV